MTGKIGWAASPAECPFAVCPMPDFEACDKCPGPKPNHRSPFDDEEPCDCCDRAGEYNGYGSGPLLFRCPKSCMCHD